MREQKIKSDKFISIGANIREIRKSKNIVFDITTT